MSISTQINYSRLAELNDKAKSGSTTRAERDELMSLLFESKSITDKQFNDYKAGKNVQDIFNAALIIGGIVLLGKIINELTSER